jgi:hypothetical protein
MQNKHKPKRKYVPVPGSHLSKSDAEKIGQGIELLFTKFGHHPQLVDKFAEAVKSPSNPAHPVVQKKFKEFKDEAWRMAVQYCLRSVDYFDLDIKGEPISAPQKAFFLLDIRTQSGVFEKTPQRERFDITTADMLREDPVRLDQYESDFRDLLRTEMADFAKLVGVAKVKRVVREEIGKLK